MVLFLAALLVDAFSAPARTDPLPEHVSASCHTKTLEVDCEVTGLPVIKDIGVDAMINTTALTVDVDLLFDGKVYQLWGLSAHNPVACVDLIAKVCVKIDDLTWDNHVVSGELELGVGVVLVGVKYFKITHFSFNYVSLPAPQRVAPMTGVWGVTTVLEGKPPATQPRYNLTMLDASTMKLKPTAAFSVGGIAQAGGAIDATSQSLYVLDGYYDGVAVSYRVQRVSLASGAVAATYPLPQVPFVQWTGFGMQLGVDGGLGVAAVVAPSNGNQSAPPFDYAVWAIDLNKNTSRVLATLPNPPGTTPIFEGFPATVCTASHTFFFITGVGDARALLGIDLVTGETKVNKTLDAPPSLTLLVAEPPSTSTTTTTTTTTTSSTSSTSSTITTSTTSGGGGSAGRLWGVGFDATQTLLLLQIDPSSGAVLRTTAATSLGGGWNPNVLPGVVAIAPATGRRARRGVGGVGGGRGVDDDDDAAAVVFPAQQRGVDGLKSISLVSLSTSAAATTATSAGVESERGAAGAVVSGGAAFASAKRGFCSLSTKAGEVNDCPKLLAGYQPPA